MKKNLIFIALFLLSPQLTGENQAQKGGSSIYSPVGKRDPFRPPSTNSQTRGVAALSPLERFNIEQLQLRAILRTGGKGSAMFEDPDGKTHIIFEGQNIGRERATVSRILNSEVILTEKTFNYLGQENLYEKVISLPKGEEAGEAVEIQSFDAVKKRVPNGIPELNPVGGIVKKMDKRLKDIESIGEGSN